ncbi:AMY1.1, partial [Symbiodinium sp. CCMP2592]
MDPVPDADVSGIDISEEEGPSPSVIPLPNFGYQGVEIDNVLPDRTSTGRDIPTIDSSSASDDREDTSEVSSDSDRSIAGTANAPKLTSRGIARAKNAAKVPEGSVGQVLQQRFNRTWQIVLLQWRPLALLHRTVGGAVSVKLKSWQGLEIFEVPLHRVVSGGTSNWALRQIAHGRAVHWENFRSKQEGVFAGVLMRALRSEQAEQEGTDFVTILNATQKKLFPSSELQDWSARYKTIQKLAEDLVKDFRKHAPVQTNQTLLQRLHALETENARLKGKPHRSAQPALPRRRGAPASGSKKTEPRSPMDFGAEDLAGGGDGEETAMFRSPAEDLFEEDEENQDKGPLDAQDTYSQYLPDRDSTLYLESCSLEATNLKSVNNWLASTAIGKGKNKVIDTAVSEFVAACAKLDDGNKKPVDKIAVEWGLAGSLASKLNEKCLTRLIAGAHLLANHKTRTQRQRFVVTFLRWFSLILPILYILMPHKVVDRFMWVRSHIFSCALFSNALPCFSTGIFVRIRDLLVQFRVPKHYPWSWHQTSHMVYLRVSVNRPATTATLYVGATRTTVPGREASRRRKFIQLVRKRLSYFEPALKVFHRRRDFYQGIVLALYQDSDTLSLLATEAALIRTLRPALNHPWVLDLLKSLRIKQNRFRLPQARTGHRFTKKCQALIRRCHGLYHQHLLNNKQVFLSLYRLGSDSLEKFLESRTLRSHRTPLQELYLRCRLVNMIDEPFKTRATQQLRLIMEFRRGHMPPTNVPLRLPPLAHDLAKEFTFGLLESQRHLFFAHSTMATDCEQGDTTMVQQDFLKARPIIGCDHCWHSRLTTFLAKAIFQIMLIVFPTGSTFNVLSVQQAVRMMWHSMMGYSADEPTIMKQQDLVGFFNSVPHDRILQSLLFVLQLLEDRWHKPWQQQSLQVSIRSKDPNFRVFRGRRRFAARNTKTLPLEDLPELVGFLLRSSFFQCGIHTFKQIQGASMGSALAPVLCTLVASTTEFLWLRNFRTILNNIGFQTAARYADNRVFHLHSGIQRNPWLQLLFHLEFYGSPIILEDVLTETFLGTTCSNVQGTITVVQPTDASTIRTLQSVGRKEHVLFGFSARVRTIIRLSRPMRLIRPQVEDLIEIYRAQGFSQS